LTVGTMASICSEALWSSCENGTPISPFVDEWFLC
jgi:hypothetical protein